MKTVSRPKTIHYKRVVFTNNHSDLQSLLNSVFQNGSPVFKAGSRKEIINPDDSSFRLINHHKEYNGMFFGQLIFLEEGRSQEFVELDDNAEFYKIDSITTDKLKYKGEAETETASKKREFIDSILYFGVYRNHLVVLQSAALRSRDLETHLSWLLGTRTESIPTSSALILQDKPTEETLKKVESSSVKKVKLGTPIDTRDEQESDDQGLVVGKSHSERKARNVKFIPCGMGVDVVRAALGEDWFNTLKLEDSLDDANLQVSLEISYLRKTSEAGQKMLDNIATSLRHHEEADVKIDLKGGGTLKGSDLKLSGPISVKLLNGRVDETDLYHQMHSWLVSKIEESEIEVDDESSED